MATSVQDQGRFGYRARGFSRSGAMDPVSLAYANKLLGNDPGVAGLEFGPSPIRFESMSDISLALGGAPREGTAWWKVIEARAGDRFELSSPRGGVWSYLAISGGVDAPLVMGSRSTNVREGIGKWITEGDVIQAASRDANAGPPPIAPVSDDPPEFDGDVRIHGEMLGDFAVGTRVDRMGYRLEGTKVRPTPPDDWSEPVLPGCIQITPSGAPYVLMVEGSTVGGYAVAAVVHSADLRLIAQRRPGERINFVPYEE